MPFQELNGINIYYEVYGEGEPVVFLGGLGMTCEGWMLQTQFFSEHFKVILIDNRGCGRSGSCETNFFISDMADDVLNLMEFLAVKKAHFICLSMGGFIGLEIAHKVPDRVLSLTLSNTSSKLDARSIYRLKLWEDMREKDIDLSIQIRDQFLWIFPSQFFNKTIFLETALRKMIDFPFKQTDMGYSQQLKACISFDSTDYLQEIRIPAIVLASKDDLIVPLDCAKKFSSEIPGLHFIMFENCGHLIPSINSKVFNQTVLDFIQRSVSWPFIRNRM